MVVEGRLRALPRRELLGGHPLGPSGRGVGRGGGSILAGGALATEGQGRVREHAPQRAQTPPAGGGLAAVTRTTAVLLCGALVAVPIAAASVLIGRDEPRPTLKRLLRTDMAKAGEARPHGVPSSYDWSKRPRVRRKAPPAGFRAATPWGHLYRCAGSRASRRAVELRGLQYWVLVAGQRKWRRLRYGSRIAGRSFPESYRGNSIGPDLVRQDGSRISVRLRPGRNFHFWLEPRALLPAHVRAVTTIVRARFVPRARTHSPCMVLAAGADFWRTPSVTAGGPRNV